MSSRRRAPTRRRAAHALDRTRPDINVPPVGPPPAAPLRAPRGRALADCAAGVMPSAAADLVSATAAELLSSFGCDGGRASEGDKAAGAHVRVGVGEGEDEERAGGAAELDDTLTLAYSASSDEDVHTLRSSRRVGTGCSTRTGAVA
jgi:hypothetical protein